jgi:hypothetical protein
MMRQVDLFDAPVERPPHADAGPIQPSEVAEMALRWLAATLALVTAWRRGRP